MKTLCYYGHRYGGDPAMLARARERFASLKELWKVKHPDRVLWAPWIEMAESNRCECVVWSIVDRAVSHSDLVVLDKDGCQLSPGMNREAKTARDFIVGVIVVDGDDFSPGSEET